MVAGVAALSGWRPGRHGQTLIACCLAALVAFAIKDQLKFAFGRLWPETWVNGNPSWIGNGAYGFNPFHGGTGWSSFPSGHMTDITAPMAVLWHRFARWRLMAALPILLVAVGLYGADYHFIGDMIAGVYLGAASAAGILVILGAEWSAGRSQAQRASQAAESGSGMRPDP
jgi:membrane-associated phospholipid phosphatase